MERGRIVNVELLRSPGCPNADAARQLLRECLAELSLDLDVTERVGGFPSPTVRVNGIDVMGEPGSSQASCRLDLPTRENIIAALSAVE
jgi:hypothetical protein